MSISIETLKRCTTPRHVIIGSEFGFWRRGHTVCTNESAAYFACASFNQFRVLRKDELRFLCPDCVARMPVMLKAVELRRQALEKVNHIVSKHNFSYLMDSNWLELVKK